MRAFSSESRQLALEYELRKERASSLGRAGRLVEQTLEALRNASETDEAAQTKLVYAAARAVHRYIVNREACGIRDHEAAIEQYGIPQRVLARVGAREPNSQ